MYSELVKALRNDSSDETYFMPLAADTIDSLTAENAQLLEKMEQLQSELSKLREVTTAAWLQLHTAAFSTNHAAAELAKFIMTYLPQPPSTAEGEK